MNNESRTTPFAEALAPLGSPDPSPALKERQRRTCARLNDIVWGATRLTTAGLTTPAVHFAALKYIFLLS